VPRLGGIGGEGGGEDLGGGVHLGGIIGLPPLVQTLWRGPTFEGGDKTSSNIHHEREGTQGK